MARRLFSQHARPFFFFFNVHHRDQACPFRHYFCRIGNFLQLHSLLQIPSWKIRREKAAPCSRANSLHRHRVTRGHTHTEHVPPAPSLTRKKKKKSIKKWSKREPFPALCPLCIFISSTRPHRSSKPVQKRAVFLITGNLVMGRTVPEILGRVGRTYSWLVTPHPIPTYCLMCSAGSHPKQHLGCH